MIDTLRCTDCEVKKMNVEFPGCLAVKDQVVSLLWLWSLLWHGFILGLETSVCPGCSGKKERERESERKERKKKRKKESETEAWLLRNLQELFA